MTKTISEHYLSMDPDYGSQVHQRAFVRRMERMQEIEPCDKDHTNSTIQTRDPKTGQLVDKPWPTHTHRCYSQKTLDAVRREER